MTPKQNLYYWRLWGEACESRGWKMKKGILQQHPSESLQESEILQIAARRATANHRATTPDDLRHACHILAAGRDCSHTALKQGEIDKLIAIFKLLIDPTNIDAAIQQEHPALGEQRRIVHKIRQFAPEAYIDAICRAQFSADYVAPFWEDLPISCLRNLSITISQRTAHWTKPIVQKLSAPTPAPEPALDCPF